MSHEKTETMNNTYVDTFDEGYRQHPQRVLFKWVEDDKEKQWTYKDVFEHSNAVATHLVDKLKLRAGDRVMIVYPFGLKFLAGLLGCIRSGIIAVSVYPPNPSRLVDDVIKFNNFVTDSGCKYALTTSKYSWLVTGTKVLKRVKWANKLKWIATDKLKFTETIKHTPEPEDIAFIQYTSGSTSLPKGVMISHRALIANITNASREIGYTADSVGFTWMPQYHDYALVSCYLSTMFIGCLLVCTSPHNFIKAPLIWAEMIEKHRVTHTAGPNFSWGLLAKRIRQNNKHYDLGSIQCANIAAEPINISVVADMAAIGVPEEAIDQTYGCAEMVAHVCSGGRGTHNGVPSCGVIKKDIVVVDEEARLVPDEVVGNILIRGADLASGYWNKPHLTAEAFHVEVSGKRYFNTGDLGFRHRGQLYVTGRKKELILINGRNVYPHDVEREAEAQLAGQLRPGCVVAFQADESTVAVVAEVYPGRSPPTAEELQRAARRMQTSTGVAVARLQLVKKGSLPKTTSGKLQRKKAAVMSFVDVLVVEYARRDGSLPTAEGSATGGEAGEVVLGLQTLCKLSRQDERRRVLTSYFEANVLMDGMDMDTSWLDGGYDSLMVVELRDRLHALVATYMHLPDTILFDYPTPAQLVAYIETELYARQSSSPAEAASAHRAPASEMQELYVTHMSHRMPVDTDFWRFLCDGGDAMVDIPVSRFDVATYFDPEPKTSKMYVRRGSFLRDLGWFDAAKFNLAAQEAACMDPQQRVLLEVLHDVCPRREHAGVFVGACSGDFAPSLDRITVFSATGAASSILANRASYLFGLTGPSMSVDTACSSSLVALDCAVNSILTGGCGKAVVAGVNLNLSPTNFIAFCTTRMLSPNNRCASFSIEADGYARGEACGCVVLMSQQAKPQDLVPLAQLQGCAVNQDGKSANLTSPNGPSQERVIRSCLARAGLSPSQVAFVEAHGTGTPLGDPIEVIALYNALCKGSDSNERKLIVGALKSNIGHTEGAAGIAGLIKVVLCLQHRLVPPNLHCKVVNPRIESYMDKICFPRGSAVSLESQGETFAGVSSFGFGGTNAHAILSVPSALRQDVSKLEETSTVWNRQAFPWKHLTAQSETETSGVEFFTTEWEPCETLTPLWIDGGDTLRVFGKFQQQLPRGASSISLDELESGYSLHGVDVIVVSVDEAFSAIAFIQRLLKIKMERQPPHLVFVHSPVNGILGLVNSIQLELPDWKLHVIQTSDCSDILRTVWDATEPVQLHRDNQILVPKLEALKLCGNSPLLDPSGDYIVTGGLGFIGMNAAKALAKHGAQSIVLLSSSRSEFPAAYRPWPFKTEPRVVHCDVSSYEATTAALVGLSNMRGVFHAAGVLGDGLVASVTREAVREVFGAKVVGMRHLDRLTTHVALEFFVACSSATVLGSPAQAVYASANTVVDEVCAARNAAGMPALSMQWGAWQGGGMASFEASSRFAATGLLSIAATDGVEAIRRLFSCNGVVMAARLDAARLPTASIFSRVRDLDSSVASPSDSLFTHLIREPAGRQQRLQAFVVAKASQIGVRIVDLHQPWQEMGMDSLSMVELRNMFLILFKKRSRSPLLCCLTTQRQRSS